MAAIEEDETASVMDSLKTTSVGEIYKKDLEKLRDSEQLSSKDKRNIDELIYLVNAISQIKIEEPKMLVRIWETFHP